MSHPVQVRILFYPLSQIARISLNFLPLPLKHRPPALSRRHIRCRGKSARTCLIATSSVMEKEKRGLFWHDIRRWKESYNLCLRSSFGVGRPTVMCFVFRGWSRLSSRKAAVIEHKNKITYHITHTHTHTHQIDCKHILQMPTVLDISSMHQNTPCLQLRQ